MARIEVRWPTAAAIKMFTLGRLIFMLGCGAEQTEDRKDTMAQYQPRGERRVITVYDSWVFGCAAIPSPLNPVMEELARTDPEGWKRSVETIVDVHADAGVDTIVHGVHEGFRHHLPASASKAFSDAGHSAPYYANPPVAKSGKTWKTLNETGYDFIQIGLDQAHKRGLSFLAGVRMNDRHSHQKKQRIYLDHPEWQLEGFPGGFDYSKPGVRERMLTFVKEVLKQYDVDGIEYDWMRMVHVFPRGTENKNAPLLTDFHRQTRELVDEAARERDRKLLFGVRVPETLEGCAEVGFDVSAWIQEALVDYIAPSHFGHMDSNAPIEDFRKLTEGTPCRVYPSTTGHTWTGPSRLEEYGPQHYYAVAHNWYAFGADGIQTYNYQFGSLQGMLPRILDLAPLRAPKILAEYDREYLLYRRRGPVTAANGAAMEYQVIHLDRATTDARGTFEFRLAEDLEDPKVSAVMEFKALGLQEREDLAVELNDEKITSDLVKRTCVWDGTGLRRMGQLRDEQGKVTGSGWQEGEWQPSCLYRIPLSSPPMIWGDNELAVALTQAADPDGLISIEEVTIRVHVK